MPPLPVRMSYEMPQTIDEFEKFLDEGEDFLQINLFEKCCDAIRYYFCFKSPCSPSDEE